VYGDAYKIFEQRFKEAGGTYCPELPINSPSKIF